MKFSYYSALVFIGAVCLFACPVKPVFSGVTDSECIHHGDVNFDGVITAADAQLAFTIVLGQYIPTFEEECAADCNGDGIVSSSDSQNIFLYALGLDECVDPIPTPTIPIQFVYIEPGTFTRGSPETEPCRESWGHDETQHQVTLTRGFNMMTTEVTRGMWSDLQALQPTLPNDPSNIAYSPTNDHPVQMNTWYEAVLFANLLSFENGLNRCYYTDPDFTEPIDISNYTTGPFYCDFSSDGYRLPTEAEWEYAARAGTTGVFSFDEPLYDDATCTECDPGMLPTMEDYAVFCANSPEMAETVGSRLPNPWGLYDMHGNVWEWVWDFYGEYPSDPVADPEGSATGEWRVKRGGSFYFDARRCRSAMRMDDHPQFKYSNLGFRLVRTEI
jgi:formylglycine-generating enzyme required for sulfatase activity